MADRPTPIDGTDRDPELERRLTALNRLQDEVTSPPPVHELTAHVRQRRTRRFAVASTAAAAAAVIAGILVLASRPDGEDTLTAGKPPATEAPPTTLEARHGVHGTDPDCGGTPPTDTLAAHGLELTYPSGPGDVDGENIRLTNRGDETVTVIDQLPTLAAVRDGRYRSVPAVGTDISKVRRVTIAPGASAELVFRIAKVDCTSGAKLTGTQVMTPIVPVTFGDTAPDAAAADRGDGLVTLVGEPAVFPFANAASTTTQPLSGTGDVKLPSCGGALPTETAADHDLDIAPSGERAPGWVGVHVTNRGKDDMAVVSMVSFLAQEVGGRVSSTVSKGAPNGSVQTIHVAPGESATVRLRVQETTCRPPRAHLTGTQTMTPVLQIGDLGSPGSGRTPHLSVVAGPAMTVQLGGDGGTPATTTPH